MMVSMPYKLAAPMFSPTGFCIVALDKTAREAKATAVVGAPWLVKQMALDGFYYYAYNEVAFITLNQVAPVTHSIANTFKRVAIILATVLVFGNKLTTLGAIGSGIAVAGTFLYSIAKQKYA